MPSPPSRPRRVALVHDWLTGMRGGEKVLEAFGELFPDADLFTLLHVIGSTSPTIEQRVIHTSALQRLPGIKRYYRHCLLLFPRMIERFVFDDYDMVISSSHCVAKSVIVPPGVAHLCYCHTPMRYAWDQFDAYFGPARLGRVGSAAMRPLMARMARWDRATASRVTRYVTNSKYVAQRIARYYDREAAVVYPPVDTEFFHPGASAPERYALVVSALVPYKRIEIAIEACQLAGVPLKIVGTGPERAALSRAAAASGANVEFLNWVSDQTLRELYSRAAVVLLPGEEDFGIVPLEAQASGRPVIALAAGGALETVLPGRTGFLVPDGTPRAFADAIGRALDYEWDSAAIRQHAEGFGRERFAREIQAIVEETWRSCEQYRPIL